MAVLCSLPSMAQQEFAPIGAKWYYCALEECGYITMESIKDTTIQNKPSKIIAIDYSQSCYPSVDNLYPNEKIFVTGDTDSVLYFQDDSFHKLYDFTSEVGDTIELVFFPFAFYLNHPYSTDPEENIISVVEYIDTIVTNEGVKLKAIYPTMNDTFDCPYQGPIVQRIGNYFTYPLGMICPDIININHVNFSYYEDVNTTLGDEFSICNIDISNISDALQAIPITIYPNPSKGIIHIDTPVFIEKIEVFNLMGTGVYTAKNVSDPTLDLAHLSKGVYFLKCYVDDGQTVTRKIVLH